jgi:predicted dehydrogenase
MKVAVVGAGNIGAIHARAYRSIGAELVAIVEPLEAVGDKFAGEHSISRYPDLDAVLSSEDRPSVVSICSPPFTHKALIERCLGENVNVLCEKPLAHTLEDATAIARLAGNAASTIATGYCHRFQPEIEKIHAMIREGAIGEVRTFHNSFSGDQPGIENRWFGDPELSGGGVIIDAGIHSIDLFRFLCGEIVEASGIYSKRLGASELGVEHTATMALRSTSDVIATIDCSWKSPEGKAIVRIAGSAGALQFDYSAPGSITYQRAGKDTRIIRIESGNRFEREVESFLEAIRSGRQPRTGVSDGLEGMRIVSHIYQQQATVQTTQIR